MNATTEAKTIKQLGRTLKLSKGDAAKIEMRTDLIIAIRNVVERKRLTPALTARRSGVSRTIIAAILSSNSANVTMDQLIDVALNIGLTVTLRVA